MLICAQAQNAIKSNMLNTITDILAANIRKLREAKGWTQHELGVKLDFPDEYAQQRVSSYEAGRRSPNKKTLQRIAGLFGTAPDELFAVAANIRNDINVVMLRLFDGIPCGPMETIDQDAAEQFPATAEMLQGISNPAYNVFWARVKGDSMEPLIKEGDLVMAANGYAEGVHIKNGDLVISVIDGAATLKRIYEHEQFYQLIPENHIKHEPILIQKTELCNTYSCLFKVLLIAKKP